MRLRHLWAVMALLALSQAGCLCWHHGGHRCCYPGTFAAGAQTVAPAPVPQGVR